MKKSNLFLLGMIVLLLTFALSLSGCSGGNNSNEMATLEIQNRSTFPDETILIVWWENLDTRIAREISAAIRVNDSQFFSLEPGEHNISITTNRPPPNNRGNINIRLEAGRTYALRWTGAILIR